MGYYTLEVEANDLDFIVELVKGSKPGFDTKKAKAKENLLEACELAEFSELPRERLNWKKFEADAAARGCEDLLDHWYDLIGKHRKDMER